MTVAPSLPRSLVAVADVRATIVGGRFAGSCSPAGVAATTSAKLLTPMASVTSDIVTSDVAHERRAIDRQRRASSRRITRVARSEEVMAAGTSSGSRLLT